MKLITESSESIKVLKEERNGTKQYHIEGVFMQSDVSNRNKRIYPKPILVKEMKRYTEDCIKKNRAMGELGHPEGPQINLERVSHMITKLWEDGNNVMGVAKILDTPYGKIVKNFIDEGISLGVSSRGLGSCKRNDNGYDEIQEDFWLSTVDIVADPSAPDAFVNGVMEGKEWIYDNGIIKEMDIENYKKSIKKAERRRLEEAKLCAFQNFLKKLKY